MAFESTVVQYRRAKADGRLCLRCGWIVKRKAFAKGDRYCEDCIYVGVEVTPGFTAHVSPGVQPETLTALAQLAELTMKQYKEK